MRFAKPYPESEYCTHISDSGRRCRALKMMTREVCLGHWKKDGDFVDDEEALAQLAHRWSAMTTTRGINRALAYLFHLTALGKISYRRAALLTYQAQNMLQSLRRGRFETDLPADAFDTVPAQQAQEASLAAANSNQQPTPQTTTPHATSAALQTSAPTPHSDARAPQAVPAQPLDAPALAHRAVNDALSRHLVDIMEEVMEPVAASVKSHSQGNGNGSSR